MLDDRALVKEAIAAREKAYAPYSNFLVGAALLTKSGKVYGGCNIENAAYGPSNCAERTAFFRAVFDGEREFEAIAVAGWARSGERGFAFPCGVCRQVMMEFCDPKTFKVLVAKSEEDYISNTLEQILPFGFGPANL
jgi:cytidine deaminase